MDWKDRYEALFADIAFKKYRVKIDYATIEKGVSHLRNGDAITYEDLDIIARDDLWAFNKYYMWPSREQIEDQLEKTWGLIVDPTEHPEKEEDMVRELLIIFKNVSLVSILLRFVWPEHYAIYSRPSLKLLHVERGYDDTEEYFNYNNEMRNYRISFGLDRTADVDMLVWAISQRTEEYADIKSLLSEKLPTEFTLLDLIRNSSHYPLKVAEAFYNYGDYETSGFWSARALEKTLRAACLREHGYLMENTLQDKGSIEFLISQLSGNAVIQKHLRLLNELRHLRNSAVHVDVRFNKQMADEFINGVSVLADEMGIKV
ncbi:MAG: HEPN domain-containing protein [Candidatus Aminicenantales bacterium]